MAKEKKVVSTLDAMNVQDTLKFFEYIFHTDIRPCLLGGTGIGKTQVIKQLAQKQNKDLIILHVSQLEPSDFVGLYKTTEDGRTMNCSPNWLPYKDAKVIEHKKGESLDKVLPGMGSGYVNPNGGYIFLDEFNRGKEDIRQSMYQFLNEKRIHTYRLPDNYEIITAANPPEGYETYEFDKALDNRLAYIRFTPTFDETKTYLTEKYGARNPVLDWANSDKSLIDYGDDFSIPTRTFSPRFLEVAIILVDKMVSEPSAFQRKALSTILAPELLQSFMSFQEEIKFLSYMDIIEGKKQDRLEELLKRKRLDVVSTLVSHLADHYGKNKIDITKDSKEVKNVSEFFSKIGAENCTQFIDSLKGYTDKNMIHRHPTMMKVMKEKIAHYGNLF
jgi:hypothetical protein